MMVFSHRITPSRPYIHFGEEVMAAGYDAVWFLFNGKPWDIGRFYRPDGSWTGYYIDVLEPVHWDGADPGTLEPLVDLFLDLWIAPDGRFAVLDEDELEAAVLANWITAGIATRAREIMAGIVAETESGTFPPEVVRVYNRGALHP